MSWSSSLSLSLSSSSSSAAAAAASSSSDATSTLLFPTTLRRVPQSLRFVVSGAIGSVLFFAADRALLASGVVPAAATFTVAYVASILWQYVLHQRLVFGSPTRARDLFACYSSYALSIVAAPLLSLAFGSVLATRVDDDERRHSAVWLATFACTSTLNYFTVAAAMDSGSGSGGSGSGSGSTRSASR